MKITIVTVSTAAVNTLINISQTIQEQFSDVLQLNIFYAVGKQSKIKSEKMNEAIISSEVVIVDLMGSPEEITKNVYESLSKAKGNIIPMGRSGKSFLRLGSLTADSMKSNNKGKKPSMESMKKMASMAEKIGNVMPGKMRDMKNLSWIRKYFTIANDYNIQNMLYLLLNEYGKVDNVPKPQKPKEIPEIGICDPNTKTYYDNYEAFNKVHSYCENKPLVAVLYYGHTYPNDTSKCVSQVVEKIKNFTNVLPIAFSSSSVNKPEKLHQILNDNGYKKVDLIMNFMSFRLGAGPMGGNAQGAIDVLKKTNVPYFHPFFMSRRTMQDWLESKQGVNSSEFMISVMLPEFDGCIETLPIGAMCEPQYNEVFDMNIGCLQLIEERADKLAKRVKKQLDLRAKKNSEKKVAVICYNYPPGEGNMFGGAFLDTFQSIHKLLCDLKEMGYKTDVLSADELIKLFTTDGLVNSARYYDGIDTMIKYPSKSYKMWLDKQPFKEDMINQWGETPGDIMTYEDDFLIPGVEIGNVFIGLQPTRGIHEHPEKVYHDKDILPHHQYIAFYRWLDKGFGADAMIHVGTHGTLEFLQGKECGMSKDCFPDRLISDIPHMYLYYAGNPSEAMIAKRRSHANIISYQPTEYVVGELYGEYASIKAMIDEYRESKLLSPIRSQRILDDVVKDAAKNNLPTDLQELEHELYNLDRTLIPKGLHIFGVPYNQEQSRNYARGLLRYDRDNMESLPRIIAQDLSLDYDELLDKNDTQKLKEIDIILETILNTYFEGGQVDVHQMNKVYTHEKVKEALHYADNIIETCEQNNETNGLLKVLNGEYNQAKLAGDIYRNPQVMPTGYNVYQFDARFIPSMTAYKRGVKIADNTLKEYEKNVGCLPKSTAVILWGLETSRTQGETVSQILAYLGVRLASGSTMWEPKYEIIPIHELGRNRVDVVITICGFFRDMFPNIIDNMNKVLAELAKLDETDEENPFKAHSKMIYENLLKEGMEEEKAKELSVARIFGPAEAVYGTGITKLIETKNWQDESVIGQKFTENTCHVYTKNYRGLKSEELYTRNLESVEIVSQIRSNHEYEVTDLDHYYEYFGGLAKSIENVKNEKVVIYITDTTAEKIETKSASDAINRGIRARLLNPKWIDGMLAHKHHGGSKIAQRFENVMGLAATTGQVEPWIYEDMHKTYIQDEKLKKRMQENNPYAYVQIIEQMTEYNRRGYWDATDEQIKALQKAYLETEGNIEEQSE